MGDATDLRTVGAGITSDPMGGELKDVAPRAVASHFGCSHRGWQSGPRGRAPHSNQEWAQGLLVCLLGAAGMACPAPPSSRPVVVGALAAA